MIEPQPAGVGQAADLAALHATAFTGPDAWSATSIAGLLASPGCYALWLPGQGFIMARAIAGEAEILTLAVAPAFRRMGLGGLLLRGAIAVAREVEATTIFLEVASNNTGALHLYRTSGFEAQGLRRHYYSDGSDALVLSLSLPNN
ncbi:GNAT family N-acetyltransferase [Rhodovarius crocodyli]|uniref:GNAT family N-acetyltransferase n=1 Tax=Rhodovarius crocodyli TaxID=1979269 RepID=A0A437MGH3_9PROT|nr:GNAT family N-acetyltransferase [Rhodovarius crocodyli]RVT96727.1 GNAT family N-acetyltransferase [Rhodovarius crocodyli]